MEDKNIILVLGLLGVGGVAIYFLTRPKALAAAPVTPGVPYYPTPAAPPTAKFEPWMLAMPLVQNISGWLGGLFGKTQETVTTPTIFGPGIPWAELYPSLYGEEPAITLADYYSETPYGLTFM